MLCSANCMTKLIKKNHVFEKDFLRFSIQSRLLQELGERLVSSPDVAISELIKNAYDADSPTCEIKYQANEFLIVRDQGHGMTLEEFKNRWMSIATGQKTIDLLSPRFRRILTGAKGVGRFAVRILGSYLTLTTVAFDRKLNCRTKIVANFDWESLDKSEDILDLKIPYSYEYPTEDTLGTELAVTDLSSVLSPDVFDNVRSDVLKIASPLSALRPNDPLFLTSHSDKLESAEQDPGFEITIDGEEDGDEGPAEVVLKNFVGRARVKWKDRKVTIEISFNGRDTIRKTFSVNTCIGTPVYADIRYFPRRKGVFRDIGVDGRHAWGWIRENHGVGIYDKGFRVRPYGMGQDDWLMLDRDVAHSERDWRSPFSKKFLAMPDPVRVSVTLNPMVNLATNFQLVGAVFVNTSAPDGGDNSDVLVPSMDRQGFVQNTAFSLLTDVVRFAVEYLSDIDKKYQLEEIEKNREEEHRKIKKDLRIAIKQIETSSTLSSADKHRVVQQYKTFAKEIDDIDEYHRRVHESLDMMGFLGVLAGFMTHEHESTLWELEEVTKLLDKLSKTDVRFKKAGKRIRENIERINEHVEYTRLFVKGINTPVKNNLRAKPRIRHAIRPLHRYAEERDYQIDIDVNQNVLMPAVPLAMYEGIVMNLFSNALKALLAKQDKNDPMIRIGAWSDRSRHYLMVCDNGVGVPPESEKYLWDPLFTTTSSDKNPLGSGMGLGLPLIKKVLESISGKIELITPISNFSTCFRATFPRKTRYGEN